MAVPLPLFLIAVLFSDRLILSSSIFLPLKKRYVPYMPVTSGQFVSPEQTSLGSNKLYFRHNISLTISLAVGSPPQNVTMVIDTGSELSWLICPPLFATSPPSLSPSPSFLQNCSTSYLPIACSSETCMTKTRDLPSPAYCDKSSKLCHVSLSYADASAFEGNLAFDMFRIGEYMPLKTIFGCMSSSYSSSPSDTMTYGLLGMNRGDLSMVTQMGTQRFSYCISDQDSSGILLIGDTELPFSLSLNYTPLIQISLPLPYFDRVAYSVELQGIRVSDVVLPIPKSILVPDHTGAGQTMVDSGTQYTFLLGPAYTLLKNEFINQTKDVLTVLEDQDFVYQGAFDLCYRVPLWKSSPSVTLLPTVTLMFRGAEMTVAGERLLSRVEGEQRDGDGIWCFTFGNSDLVPLEAYVIGHHHQQNVWVEYDIENGRVGFAPVQCDVASQTMSALGL